jgi:hypothetical protein
VLGFRVGAFPDQHPADVREYHGQDHPDRVVHHPEAD